MKDLTTVVGTYVQLISTNMDRINAAIEDYSVNGEALKKLVKEVIEPANDTPAKKNFIYNLDKKHSKTDIAVYVMDAWFCGSGLGMNASARKYK